MYEEFVCFLGNPHRKFCVSENRSRAHLAVSTEWVLSQTNESCLCKSSSPFTMGLHGSQYDYVIHVALITILRISLSTSFQPPLCLAQEYVLMYMSISHLFFWRPCFFVAFDLYGSGRVFNSFHVTSTSKLSATSSKFDILRMHTCTYTHVQRQ